MLNRLNWWKRICSMFVLLLVLILPAGCGDSPTVSDEEPIAIRPLSTAMPTPSLAPGLPTAPPPPPTLAAGVTPDTPTPTTTPTPSATPTATPKAAERIELGRSELASGDFTGASSQFQGSLESRSELSRQQQSESLYSLGISYFRDENYLEAIKALEELEQLHGGTPPSEIYFYLAQAEMALGGVERAIESYQIYLGLNPTVGAYVGPYLAEAYWATGDHDKAVAVYESALTSTAYPPAMIRIREQLASFYMESENYLGAADQYAAAEMLASSGREKGRFNHLAGYALLLSGDVEAGYGRYQAGLQAYPEAFESYQGLLALIEAEISVTEYDRGVVDYYAAMYDPAIEAFQRLFASGIDYPADAHLFAALSYELVGQLESALAEAALYLQLEPAKGLIERAKIQARSGTSELAIASYLSYLESFPSGEQAPFAAWWAAAISEQLGQTAEAAELYRRLADEYPWHEDAPEALFHAGWLSHVTGDETAALESWRRAAEAYPSSHFGAAALFWLMKSEPEIPAAANGNGSEPYPPEATIAAGDAETSGTPTPAAAAQLAAASRSDSYYAVRVKELVDGREPFVPATQFSLPSSPQSGQRQAEAWLRRWLRLGEDVDVSSLSEKLAADPRISVGEKLWRIGLFEEAKRELESLRRDAFGNPLESYQLALYFRDLGLYRSSILAASELISLAEQPVSGVPVFIGRLAYPVYFADLIVPLADQYGYDPRLQFALVRQESLFESFARSGAAAQGLAQVIPDTGAYIAQRLNWPGFENEDLFKPYVGLTFGAYYLDLQLDYFDQQVHVALSAYNGGPGNAARWYAAAPDDFDTYLETVDFAETRLYIERIFVGYVIYNALYGQ